MHVRDEGSGPAVVLLHGQPGRGEDWDAVAARLVDDHRVIVPDRPGYGRSQTLPAGLREYGDAVAAMLAERGVERATVAGHSWGGGVALALALDHPERVSGLVLAASIGAASSVDLIDRVLALPVLGDALVFTGLRFFSRFLLVPPVRRAVTPVAGALPDDALRAKIEHWRSQSIWRSFLAEQRAMVAELPDIATRLGEVQAPAVVEAGDRDRLLPPRASRDLADGLPDARLMRVRGSHMLPFDAPDQLADEIRALTSAAADNP